MTMDKLQAVVAAAAILAGCSDGGGERTGKGASTAPPATAAPSSSASGGPFGMTGTVRDARGNPVAGADVFADETVFYNSNVTARTRPDGGSRIQLPKVESSWAVGGTVTREYEGRSYSFHLRRLDDSHVSAGEGGERHLEWRISGPVPGGGIHGGTVHVSMGSFDDPQNPETPIQSRHIRLTLTPQGPLVDGSAGKPISGPVKRHRWSGGEGIEDVPVGRYTLVAEYAPPGVAPRPMIVQYDGGDYAASADVLFEQQNLSPRYLIEVNVKLPGA